MQDEEALDIYRKQLEENPEDLNARFCMACALFRLEKYAESQEHFERILALDRDSLEAKLSHEWLERIFMRMSPEGKTDGSTQLPEIFPLSVAEIVQKKKTYVAMDESMCFFHPDKEKKFSCSFCKKSLCSLCGSLRKGAIVCPECVAKGAVSVQEEKKVLLHPLLRGVLSGLIVSVFLSLFTSALQNMGLNMILLGLLQPSHRPPYVFLYLIHLLHFAFLLSVAGAFCEYYEKLSLLACAWSFGVTGLGFGLLFSLLIGTETVTEFVVPVFQFFLLSFLSGFFVSFVDNTFFIPVEDIKWKR